MTIEIEIHHAEDWRDRLMNAATLVSRVRMGEYPPNMANDVLLELESRLYGLQGDICTEANIVQ